MRWTIARKDPTAPIMWRSFRTNEDQALIADIAKQIAKKCLGKHDLETVLVVETFPEITTSARFEALKNRIAIPSSISFAAIYVAATFHQSSVSPGGYFCWELANGKI